MWENFEFSRQYGNLLAILVGLDKSKEENITYGLAMIVAIGKEISDFIEKSGILIMILADILMIYMPIAYDVLSMAKQYLPRMHHKLFERLKNWNREGMDPRLVPIVSSYIAWHMLENCVKIKNSDNPRYSFNCLYTVLEVTILGEKKRI